MGKYTKTIVAAVVAGVVALQVAVTDGTVTPSEWVTIALAVLGALGVYAAPNTTTPAQHRTDRAA